MGQSLAIPDDELPSLRSAMRDIQVTIGDFYRETSHSYEPDVLATRVRTVANFIHVLNELLRNESAAKAAYRLLREPDDSRLPIILAFQYARNLMQHVLHPVAPQPGPVFGGVGIGIRTYVTWDDVPEAAHQRLRSSTQSLRGFYDSYLRNREVTGTMLDAALAYFEICPDIVHRDQRGEWTGFPLQDQPGVGNRLHPEEPRGYEDGLTWLDSRRPGGDCRVITGALRTKDGDSVLYGYTFAGRCSFLPFLETTTQVARDIKAGYSYRTGDVAAHVTDRAAEFAISGRAVYCSDTDVATWASLPLEAPPANVESGTEALDWSTLWSIESERTQVAYVVRRARRLNALDAGRCSC